MGRPGGMRVASRDRLAGRGAQIAACALLSLTAACEFPTQAPQFEQKWVIPTDSSALQVDSLVPPSIRVVGNTFQLQLSALNNISRNYSSLCPGCPTGSNVAKRSFTASVPGTLTMDPDILTSTVTSGSVNVTLTHTFAFDPLRPSAANRGFVVTILRNNGAIIGKDSVNGAQVSWPAGAPGLVRSVSVTAGAVLVGDITVDITIRSPDGDPATISAAQGITVAISPQPLVVNAVRVRVLNRSVGSNNQALNLSDIDQSIGDRVVSGAMLITFGNPFAIAGTMTVAITAPAQNSSAAVNIVKSVTLTSAATSAVRIGLTNDEWKSIIGKANVKLKLAGSVSGPAAGVNVAPGQALGLSNRLELTLKVGG